MQTIAETCVRFDAAHLSINLVSEIAVPMFTTLKPVSLLSLTLQKGGADIVTSIENTLKSVKALKSLSDLAPIEWPTVKLVNGRLKDVGDQKEYQGVALQNFDSTLEQCKKHVMDDIRRLEQKIKERLEWSDIQLLRSIL